VKKLPVQDKVHVSASKKSTLTALYWLSYQDRYISNKVEFQEQAKKFLHNLNIQSVAGNCTVTRVVQLCKLCDAVLLEAKKPSPQRLLRDKKHNDDKFFNRRTWEDIVEKNKKTASIGASKDFRLSSPFFQQKPGCSFYMFSVLNLKIKGVHHFQVSEDLYLNQDLLDLAQ
jgi:hypothetical protein